MSTLMKPAKIELTLEQTLEACRSNDKPAWWNDRFQVRSQALCDFLNGLEKDGFVYNAEGQAAFEKLHNLTPAADCGTVISTLVYNAQCYRRSDKLRAEGWEPLTPDMVGRAILLKAKIEVMGHNVLCQSVTEACRPMLTNGAAYVLLPRARNKGFPANGEHLARIIRKECIDKPAPLVAR